MPLFSSTLILTSRLPSRPCHEVIWRKSHKLNIFIEKILNKNLTSFGNSPKVDNYGRYCRHRIEVSGSNLIPLQKNAKAPYYYQHFFNGLIEFSKKVSIHRQNTDLFIRYSRDGTRRSEGRRKKRPWGGSWLRPPFAMKKIPFSAAIILIYFWRR